MTKGLRKEIRFLKKLRAKRARQNSEIWSTTSAWDVI